MSDFIEYVTEILVVGDSLRVARDAKTSERVRVKDRMTATVGAVLSDSVRVSDMAAGGVTGRYTDKAKVRDQVTGHYHQDSMTNERLRVRDALRGTIGARLTETAQLKDEVRAGIGVRTADRVRVAGEVGQVGLGSSVREKVKVKDRVSGALLAQLSEHVTVSDKAAGQVVGRVAERITVAATLSSAKLARSSDKARVRDSASGMLTGAALVERTRVKDRATGAVTARLQEAVKVADSVVGSASVLARSSDSIRVADLLRGRGSVTGRITERMVLADQLRGQYSATAQMAEVIYVDDQLPGLAGQGFAWTAPVEGWAMSRYDRYPIESVVLVDGVAYGCGADGVYALTGGDEVIEARLTTARMDVGKGALAHPTYAYLEYELDGKAVMGVSQTQGGVAAESWDYPLDAEPADVLTNGRFVFGRGLRGRHFAFDLKLRGNRAHIDDLYVVADAIKRRV